MLDLRGIPDIHGDWKGRCYRSRPEPVDGALIAPWVARSSGLGQFHGELGYTVKQLFRSHGCSYINALCDALALGDAARKSTDMCSERNSMDFHLQPLLEGHLGRQMRVLTHANQCRLDRLNHPGASHRFNRRTVT